MRALILFFMLVLPTTISEAKKGLDIGDWVSFKGTTVIGPQTIEMSQKYAIVGQEKSADGDLLWFETDTKMSGNRILTKLLVPAKTFEQKEVNSPEFYKSMKRWIMKIGDQPAMELPLGQAMEQLKTSLGLTSDPNAKMTEMGEEVVETPKGQWKCMKKRYQGKASMEQAQGPMVMTITNTYDRIIWHSTEVPIVGYVKSEENGLMEVSMSISMPGAPPNQPQKTHSQVELVGFGKGAMSALTEEAKLAEQFGAPGGASSDKSEFIGKPAPGFVLRDIEDQVIKLADFKGKVLIVDFWATWCGPCRAEIPNFITLQTQYAPKGFSMIGISTDNTPEVVKRFAAELKVNYPLLMTDAKVQRDYGSIQAIPTTFVIDKKGIIRYTYVGVPSNQLIFQRNVEQLLAE